MVFAAPAAGCPRRSTWRVSWGKAAVHRDHRHHQHRRDQRAAPAQLLKQALAPWGPGTASAARSHAPQLASHGTSVNLDRVHYNGAIAGLGTSARPCRPAPFLDRRRSAVSRPSKSWPRRCEKGSLGPVFFRCFAPRSATLPELVAVAGARWESRTASASRGPRSAWDHHQGPQVLCLGPAHHHAQARHAFLAVTARMSHCGHRSEVIRHCCSNRYANNTK
jgi:hypothetical protein